MAIQLNQIKFLEPQSLRNIGIGIVSSCIVMAVAQKVFSVIHQYILIRCLRKRNIFSLNRISKDIPKMESFQTVLIQHLQRKDLFSFIKQALLKKRPELIRQLFQYLLGLENFQEKESRMGLIIYLQEITFPDALQHQMMGELFFLEGDIHNSVHPWILPDLSRLCLEWMDDLFDNERRMKVFPLADGNIQKKLQELCTSEERKFIDIDYITLTNKPNYYLQTRLLKKPPLQAVDFAPFIDKLNFN
jgi:hypothetical protein